MGSVAPSAHHFWEQYGTLSTVDWCEPNYVWSAYVAEWFNTLSSLPMAAWGVVGLVQCARSSKAVAARFYWVYAGLVGIGLGSAAFHGTLLRMCQALDELPMIGLSLVSVYCLAGRLYRVPDRRRLQAAPRDVGRSARLVRRADRAPARQPRGGARAHLLLRLSRPQRRSRDPITDAAETCHLSVTIFLVLA